MLHLSFGIQLQLQDKGEIPARDAEAQVQPFQQFAVAPGLQAAQQGEAGELQVLVQDFSGFRMAGQVRRRQPGPDLDLHLPRAIGSRHSAPGSRWLTGRRVTGGAGQPGFQISQIRQ